MVNREINVLDKHFCFSKVLRDIDSKLKFNNMTEEKSLFIINQLKRKKREKLKYLQRKYNHNEILYNLNKAYENNKILLKIKGKLREKETDKKEEKLPTIKKPTTSKNKVEKKEENKNNKEKALIIEDDKNKPEQFSTVWKEEILKKYKIIEKVPKNILIDDEDENANDIFDKSYRKEKNKIIDKIKIMQRIKENNLKAKIKLQNYKTMLIKYSEKKEYTPNFTAVEKHKPEIKLDTKSQRIFPIKFIQMHNYRDDRKIFKKKLFKTISTNSEKKINYSINPCSFFIKNPEQKISKNATVYKVLSKSIINKDSINSPLLEGFLSKSNSMLIIGKYSM